MLFRSITAAIALASLASGAALADSADTAWSDIRAELYGERAVAEASDAQIVLDLPYRAKDDRRVPIRAAVRLNEGESIKSLSLIVDENPMPVSAVFDLSAQRSEITVEVAMRLNGPSPVRAVVETSDGRLMMSEAFVKTSGVGACAAAPGTDVEEALALLGEMDMLPPTGAFDALKGGERRDLARIDFRHPQHSGMQMDQISLLYIPARYIETVEVWGDDEKLFTMTGSISLSENPSVAFGLPQDLPQAMRVRLTDTEDATFERRFQLGGA